MIKLRNFIKSSKAATAIEYGLIAALIAVAAVAAMSSLSSLPHFGQRFCLREIFNFVRRAQEIQVQLRFALESEDRNTVFWIERRGKGFSPQRATAETGGSSI